MLRRGRAQDEWLRTRDIRSVMEVCAHQGEVMADWYAEPNFSRKWRRGNAGTEQREAFPDDEEFEEKIAGLVVAKRDRDYRKQLKLPRDGGKRAKAAGTAVKQRWTPAIGTAPAAPTAPATFSVTRLGSLSGSPLGQDRGCPNNRPGRFSGHMPAPSTMLVLTHLSAVQTKQAAKSSTYARALARVSQAGRGLPVPADLVIQILGEMGGLS